MDDPQLDWLNRRSRLEQRDSFVGEKIYTRNAVLSDDGVYRYLLTRTWDPFLPALIWCMLNPSVADHEKDDPTVRKCIGFATKVGMGGVIIINLYAYRATDPKELKLALRRGVDIVGPDNDRWIHHALSEGARTTKTCVVGWGNRFGNSDPIATRAGRVVGIARDLGTILYCLGKNEKTGAPYHPLMLAYDTPMTEWSPR